MTTPKRRRNAPAPRSGKPHLILDKNPRTIRQHGKTYKFWLVYGAGLDGKRIRRKFKSYEAGRRWKASQDIAILNGEGALNTVTTRLSSDTVRAAEAAFDQLDGRADFGECVTFFLKHHRSADSAKRFRPALCKFLAAKERSGLRSRTIDQLEASLKKFERFVGDDTVLHEIDTERIEEYMEGLRSREGGLATSKTWNNTRAELHSFFEWCTDRRRGWLAENPVAPIERRKVERGVIESLNVECCRELMDYVAAYKGGRLQRYFALALFAGIRTAGELPALDAHSDREKLIDLERGVIWIPEKVSKTSEQRRIVIRPNLAAWLANAPKKIMPSNHDRDLKAIRKRFKLPRNVLRHTFISMHVGAFGSVGEAALEAGNSEVIIRRHYLDTRNLDEGKDFWGITPTDGKIVAMAG